ncbi:SpoIID/LytB domain-containing protein [Nocardioides sp. MH1]|uniref:SpoIID/LytB domain-containing protein n=1 Tax=Nocardioides sp. MH1 TaxID=3242490 RepID=UPI0035212950
MVKAIGLLAVSTLLLVGAPVATPAHAADDPDQRGPAAVVLKGRGFGHGRGMSQYGAQSAASDHGKTYRRILRFYYPGLTIGDASGTISVLISSDTGDDVVVKKTASLSVRQVSNGRSWKLGDAAPRATKWKLTAARGNAATRVSYLTSHWHSYKVVPGEAEFSGGSKAVTLVDPAGTRRYQGTLRSTTSPEGDRDTVNVVSLEDYLRGVVPSEMPAQWDPDAVKAQAVAARTYADYARDHPKSYYDICSSTLCQVYLGVGNSEPESDAAIRATAHEVLQSDGASAYTEFSSSNGGWTVAGSQPYLVAKQDTWDPVNTWRYRLPATKIERAYGSIGDFRRLDVLERDGHGTWNGRVLSIKVVGRRGSVTVTGDDFRYDLSLRSTWFREV